MVIPLLIRKTSFFAEADMSFCMIKIRVIYNLTSESTEMTVGFLVCASGTFIFYVHEFVEQKNIFREFAYTIIVMLELKNHEIQLNQNIAYRNLPFRFVDREFVKIENIVHGGFMNSRFEAAWGRSSLINQFFGFNVREKQCL